MPKTDKRHQLSSPLTIDKEQRLPQHFIRNATPTSEEMNNDEHQEIALYTNQLALITEKQYFNPTGIRSRIRFAPNQDRSRRGCTDYQRAERKLIISKLEAENR
jgi:hypothetical protein